MSWTDERIETLRTLWTDGQSASQIAGVLGGGITRNAVIGKVHRLKLPGRAQPARRPAARRRYAAGAPRALWPRFSAPHAAKEITRTADEIPPLAPAPEQRITTASIQAHQCRWPEGDPKHSDFHFCGRSTAPGTPYCPHHHARATAPTAKRPSQPHQWRPRRLHDRPGP